MKAPRLEHWVTTALTSTVEADSTEALRFVPHPDRLESTLQRISCWRLSNLLSMTSCFVLHYYSRYLHAFMFAYWYNSSLVCLNYALLTNPPVFYDHPCISHSSASLLEICSCESVYVKGPPSEAHAALRCCSSRRTRHYASILVPHLAGARARRLFGKTAQNSPSPPPYLFGVGNPRRTPV